MSPHDDLDDLIGAYVLDAVDPDERRRVEAAMDADPLLRIEVLRLRSAFDEVLEVQVPQDTPAPDLWSRIAGQITDRSEIGSADRVVDPAPAEPPAEPRAEPDTEVTTAPVEGDRSAPLAPVVALRTGPPRLAVLAVAAVVVAVLAIGTAVWRSRPVDVRETAAAVLAEPGTIDGVLHAPSGADGPSIHVVVDKDLRAFALPSGVAAPPAGHEYQLWSLDGPTPTSLGMMGDGTSDASMPLPAAATRVAVTVEPTGGSPKPSGPPVLVGELA